VYVFAPWQGARHGTHFAAHSETQPHEVRNEENGREEVDCPEVGTESRRKEDGRCAWCSGQSNNYEIRQGRCRETRTEESGCEEGRCPEACTESRRKEDGHRAWSIGQSNAYKIGKGRCREARHEESGGKEGRRP